jgi:ABC-type polysaccharide/polyol phosphate transport system ATPase subunit
MSQSSILEVSNISKRYLVKDPVTGKRNEFWALKDVSFLLPKGHCLGLTGSNGSGKSTLLKIISRIVTPTTGSITVNGTMAPLLDLSAGFHSELTGRENIYVYGSLIGIKRKELKQNLDEIVDFAGVSQFLDTKLRSYSSGMKMRLAFSIASTVKQDLLLADEIFAVGDESFKKQSLQKIETLKKEGTSIIMVQHDNALISQVCDSEIMLEHGRLAH